MITGVKAYCVDRGMMHPQRAWFHQKTQVKLGRYNRSMNNVIHIQHYYLPDELERETRRGYNLVKGDSKKRLQLTL